MALSMFVASELATAGSVMAKHDRISPVSNGRNHRSCCSTEPYRNKTSMLPVSGAEQLNASLAQTLAPMTSARYAYSRFVSPGPANSVDSSPSLGRIFNSAALSRGSHKFHNPALLAAVFNDSTAGDTLHRSGVMACASSSSSALYTCACMKCLSLFSNDAALALGSNPTAVADVVSERCARSLTPRGTFAPLTTNNARLAKTSTSCPISCAFALDALPCIARARTPARIAAPRNNESAI